MLDHLRDGDEADRLGRNTHNLLALIDGEAVAAPAEARGASAASPRGCRGFYRRGWL